MESKLPKPSFLRKPTQFSSPVAKMPLNELGNIPVTNVVRKRAASPDFSQASSFNNRAKLRRSRSACDVKAEFIRPKFLPTSALPTIQAKQTFHASSKIMARPVLRRSRSACDLAIKANAIKGLRQQDAASAVSQLRVNKATVTKPVVSKPMASARNVVRPTTSNSIASINSSSSSNASKRGAAAAPTKSMAKRIPPYDYKARFNDLLEKHKVLKDRFEALKEQVAHLELYEQCKSDLAAIREEFKLLSEEHGSNLKQNEMYKIKNAALCRSLSETETQLSDYKKRFHAADKENIEMKTNFAELKEKSDFHEAENKSLMDEISKCKELLFKANLERKDLHNQVMDLRGNIRVFCRVRPPLPNEMERAECGWNYLDEHSLEILSNDMSKNKATKHDFTFDHVFHPRTTQEDIFENVSPLIQSALDGFNICIFAYGQTGSGKTYTMDGVENNLGVIPKTVDLIFDSIDIYKRLGWEYEIRVTFLEIYNEILYDLLDTSGTTKELDIRMANAKSKTEIYVSNIIEETVQSAAKLRQLMNIAKMQRATAATIGNERSSRSHAVTRIELIGYHEAKDETSVGSVNLVDLAGSESPKTSVRMDETKNINRSLSELSNVILALVQRQEHIPYRNSKLTHLLMPSLGGNSKTLMFVNVAPFQDCFTETVKSLRFAAQVNSCKAAKAKRNKFLNNSNMV